MAFYAHNTPLLPTAAASWRNSTAIFEAVETNYGSGYDATTGVFTAPVEGVYVFSLFYTKTAGANEARLAIKVSRGAIRSDYLPSQVRLSTESGPIIY